MITLTIQGKYIKYMRGVLAYVSHIILILFDMKSLYYVSTISTSSGRAFNSSNM